MDRFAVYGFETTNAIASNLTDGEFKEHVNIAKKHCQRGDVFQLVLSRKFQQEFKGDEFNVYRALRSINPSPYCSEVTVENYREIQFFSHVIHLVSKVTGTIRDHTSTMQIVADTFPAGTLSGAPKYKAMELIETYEKTSRGFYGGAIGFMDFEGNYNHAIMIRTFLSKNQQLHWQAGAGIVSKSNPENELQEVFNKLGALTNAIKRAEKI